MMPGVSGTDRVATILALCHRPAGLEVLIMSGRVEDRSLLPFYVPAEVS